MFRGTRCKNSPHFQAFEGSLGVLPLQFLHTLFSSKFLKASSPSSEKPWIFRFCSQKLAKNNTYHMQVHQNHHCSLEMSHTAVLWGYTGHWHIETDLEDKSLQGKEQQNNPISPSVQIKWLHYQTVLKKQAPKLHKWIDHQLLHLHRT